MLSFDESPAATQHVIALRPISPLRAAELFGDAKPNC